MIKLRKIISLLVISLFCAGFVTNEANAGWWSKIFGRKCKPKLEEVTLIENVTLKVVGMKCEKCPPKVKSALQSVKGVQKVDVDLVKKEAIVEFDKRKASPAQLAKAVTKAGFPASTKGITESTFEIEGMTCGGCSKPVQSALLKISGVYEATVSHKEAKATVKFDKERVTTAQLTEVVENCGFSCKMESK